MRAMPLDVLHQYGDFLRNPHFVEVYGIGNIMKLAGGNARNLNIEGIGALDLRTKKPDGTPWNFCKRSDRRLAYRLIKEQQPTWIVGAPPCTSFCTWNVGLNRSKMDPEK